MIPRIVIAAGDFDLLGKHFIIFIYNMFRCCPSPRKMSDLKKFAQGNGVSAVELEDCEDTEAPKVVPWTQMQIRSESQIKQKGAISSHFDEIRVTLPGC